MWLLAYSNAFNVLWPIFGTANQLLAALVLLAVSAWLLLRRKKNTFTLIPAVFMILTTVASLVILMTKYIQSKNYTLVFADALLMILSGGAIWLFLKTFLKPRRPPDIKPA
jgi:carbon starvation protein